MTETADLLHEDPADEGPRWPEVRAWLQSHAATLVEDRALLQELGLRPHGPNVVDFGAAALSRVEAVAAREAGARKAIEGVARANFAAQAQTHVAVLDLMEARNPSDLARRLDAAAQARFGLAGASIVLEKPGGIPFGWRALEPCGVDGLLGRNGLHRLGTGGQGLGLFGAAEDEVHSVALVRMAPHVGPNGSTRPGLCAFGSPDPEGFTPEMGCELAAFLTRVIERMAERWPILS
ncbi:MAG: DUF484 family protein [Brevundimonas sp.]|uniref:DUF484 family protein n=1 Tax=Brevundimonas sp. TaxID=1871086 RepID=UPI002AB8ABED|nr:DUF484 family protein [Brevundimonas sp.]MDZ4109656.1 DUF484 family protein [Brevundimonas sp.]